MVINLDPAAYATKLILLPGLLGTSQERSAELFVEAVLREYDSIREESMQSSLHQNRLLQWGATALVGFYTFSFGAWISNPFLTLVTFLFLIPTLASTLFTLWLSEVARMKRAGEYLCILERKLSIAVSQPHMVWGLPEIVKVTYDLSVSRKLLSKPLSWEHWLRAPSSSRQLGHLGWKYLHTANVLRFAGFLSLILGGIYLFIPGSAKLDFPITSLLFSIPAASYAYWLSQSIAQIEAVASKAVLITPDWVKKSPERKGAAL